VTVDIEALINNAVSNYRLNLADIEVAEWDYKTAINDVPPAEVVLGLSDDAGPCWTLSADNGVERLCRVVLLRVRSLDAVLYVQHRHPQTNLALRTDRDVEYAVSHLRGVSLPELGQNQPRLHQAIAGALRIRFMRQLPVDIATARAEIETRISDISQREWAAGWHVEAEHRVWAMLSPEHTGEFDGEPASALRMDEVARLIELADLAGGWPMDRGSWVPMDLWLKMHALWASKPREAA
jgi:hypothetical protein